MKKVIFIILAFCITNYVISQNIYFINSGGNNGNGTHSNPFNSWDDAMKALVPGDTLMVMSGTYTLTSAISPQKSGTASKWITIKGADFNNRPVLLPSSERALLIQGIKYYRFENIEVDGGFIPDQLVLMRGGNSDIVFRNCKFGKTSRDGFAISESDNVIFDKCEIFYCINYSNGSRKDAHGIMYNSGSKLTVMDCNIHHNTGDCIQVGTQLKFPVWDSLVVINSHLWNGPVNEMVNGVPRNTYFGENAIDTKTPDSVEIDQKRPGYRGYVYIDNVIAHGFNGDYDWPAIAINMTVDATIKNTIVYESAIAFRLMGSYQPSWGRGVRGPLVKMINCIAYDNYWAALWPENNISSVKIWNCTFVKPDTIVWMNKKAKYFDGRTKFNKNGWDMRNTIFVDTIESFVYGTEPTIYKAQAKDFVSYSDHYYQLAFNSGAVNTGVDIPEVTTDIEGHERKANHYDIGAYEADNPDNPVYVISLKIKSENGSDSISCIGESLKLLTVVEPSYATLKTVTWSVINGTGAATINYSGVVTSISPGSITIRATANDGSGIYDDFELRLLDLPPINAQNSISVFPNPANNNVKFKINSEKDINGENTAIRIVNYLGQEIFISSPVTYVDNTFIADISSLQPGFYFLLVYSGNNTFKQKFIKR